MLQTWFRRFASGSRRGPVESVLFLVLAPFSFIYSSVMMVRAAAYRSGILPSRRLPMPVVSVGNLTVGGTGKTPMVALIARTFLEKGMRVAVLSRGYGSSGSQGVRVVSDGERIRLGPEEAGDEPYLLATTVPGVVVIVGSDRYGAGLLARERFGADIAILDDGFQRLQIARNLNLLLLDSRRPFGNGLTLPGGLLRESRSAADRADLVIHTRWNGERAGFVPGKPWCRAVHRITGLRSLADNRKVAVGDLINLRGGAFAGIAEPEPFFASLRELGLKIETTIPFGDHCPYGERDIEEILAARGVHNIDYLICTGKDGVKIRPHLERLGTTFVTDMEMELLDVDPFVKSLEILL